ncbi:hypothetical protein PHYPSEUDO_007707 [Phytophthora pseudosyringae]|uniref:Uncharacterized protein n=1 Tax=Phytophthora pseudosyringae TaxID=221518 RepID=A0A8T1WB53_9STRA|nr:hypothetical protein PHYPSEUDO_007707 [Phytophthora pseudosyringae]
MVQPGQISSDELVVLQLLEEIQRLVELAGGETKPGEDVNPRMHPAAKLYLDTRDTFEVIEQLVEEHVKGKPKLLRKLSKQPSNSEAVGTASPQSPRETPVPNDAAIDRIQEMFRHLGSLLGPSILKELRLRKLSIQAILHYVRFLPMEFQWTAYKEARKEEVELVYRETVFNSLTIPPTVSHITSQTDSQTLRQRADFVKHQIRKDVDTVCLFAADGTLTTIFGDDGTTVEENVAVKFESLIADVYSRYLRETVDVQMKHLTQVSDQWAHDGAVASSSSKHAAEIGPPLMVQCFYRPRKFRSKGGIFPNMLMNLVNRFVHLPAVHPGQRAKLLVADPRHVGVWWQKAVFSVAERDVTTLHDDESRDIFERVETLDGQLYVPLLGKGGEQDGSRLFGRSGGLAKWVGQRVLVNNGKDSVWVEVVVVDVDDKRCKLQIKKSLQKCAEVVSWTQFLSLNEWINMRELRYIGVPVNPHFRVQMGLKFREVLESVQAVVVEVSSVFPNGELNDKVGNALWKSVEPSISKGEHIFARYFRSILQQDVLAQVQPAAHSASARSVSLANPSSLGNALSAQESAPQSVVRDMGSSRAVVNSARGSSIRLISQAEAGFFDESGAYFSRQPSRLGRSGTPARATLSEGATATRVLSPFEKLAHHLLEETEIIGTCIQAQNVALSCAFVQVLLEKIAKMKRHMQTMLQLPSCTVEYVVSEHANSCRLLFVWRICRHQVDTMARQGRKSRRRNLENDSRYIHLNWVDHAFERVETQILEMMNSLVHYAHRAFFHECMSHLLPGIYEQSWTLSKPWFGNTRCTYAVQGFVFRMQLLLEYVHNTVLVGYERNLGVHEKMYELTVRMLLDVLTCIAEAYENLVVSRSREEQWKIDILYLVCGVYKLLRQLDQMFSSRGATQSAKGKRKAMNDIRFICLRLLVHLAIRSGPANVIVDTLKMKVQADSFEQYAGVDTISELESHVVSILDSLDPKGDILGDFGIDESEKELWRIHTVFGTMEIKKLIDVQLNWTALVSRSSLPKQTLMGFLQQRHELGDWIFPALTEAELQSRGQIQQFIDQANCDSGQHEQEESAAPPSEETPEANSHNNDSPQQQDAGGGLCEDTRSLNLPT